MLVISDGLGALRFESISFPFTRTLWNDARSTGRRECGKAIYHDHSPAHYRFHFWHIIKGNRFITNKFRIYFHSTTSGKRLVLTFVIFFFPEGNKDRTSDSGCWRWAEAGFFTGCFVCLFVFFSVISVLVLWLWEDTGCGTPVKGQLVEVAFSWHGQHPQDRAQVAGFGGRCLSSLSRLASPCLLIWYPGTMSNEM